VLLPDEKLGYTPIPNAEADAAIKLLAKCPGGRDLAVAFMIRRNIGRSNQGSYRDGVVEGLTTSAVDELLRCGSGTASRVRSRVAERLGLRMVADGKFQLKPAGADAANNAEPTVESNSMTSLGLDPMGAEAGEDASAATNPDGNGLKPASPVASQVPQDLQALQELQEPEEIAKHSFALLPPQPGKPGLPACAGPAGIPGFHFVAPVTTPTSSDWDPGCIREVLLADLLNSDFDEEGYRASLNDARASLQGVSGLLAGAAPPALPTLGVYLPGNDQDKITYIGPSGPYTPSITAFQGLSGCGNITAIGNRPYGLTCFTITAVGTFPSDTRTEVPALPEATEASGPASAPEDEAPSSPEVNAQNGAVGPPTLVPALGPQEAHPSPAPPSPSPAVRWALSCVEHYNAQTERLPEGFNPVDVDCADGSYTVRRLVGLFDQGAADDLDALVSALSIDDFLQGNNKNGLAWHLERLAKQTPARLQKFAGYSRRKLDEQDEAMPEDLPAARPTKGRNRRGGKHESQGELAPWLDEPFSIEKDPGVGSYFLYPPSLSGEEPTLAVQEVERPKPSKQPEDAPLPLTFDEGRIAMDVTWGRLLDDILAAAPRRPGEALGEVARMQVLIATERARRGMPGAVYVRRSFESLMAETKPDTQEGFCERVVGWLEAGQFEAPDAAT